jgi:hypothetical protein
MAWPPDTRRLSTGDPPTQHVVPLPPVLDLLLDDQGGSV